MHDSMSLTAVGVVAAFCIAGIVLLLVVAFSFRSMLQHQRGRPAAALKKFLLCEKDQVDTKNVELGLSPPEASSNSISSQRDATTAAVSTRPIRNGSFHQLSKNNLVWKPKAMADRNNTDVLNHAKAIKAQHTTVVRSSTIETNAATQPETCAILPSSKNNTYVENPPSFGFSRSIQWKRDKLPDHILFDNQASSFDQSSSDVPTTVTNEREGKSSMVGKRLGKNREHAPAKIPRTLSRTAHRNVDGRLPIVGREALEAILEAQDGGLLGYPEYEQALCEIQQGRKRSCWMWYIWPSMQGIRSHRMPQMLLPSLEGAIEYLNHNVLRQRLIEITSAADQVLSSGRPASLLFGGELDSTKVHEACTFFGIAAAASKRMEDATLFIRLVQHHYDGLNGTVMTHFQNDNTTDQRLLSAVSQLANHYSRR